MSEEVKEPQVTSSETTAEVKPIEPETELKRKTEGKEKKDKKRRRRQYDDAPEEEEEGDEDDDDDEDDEKLDAKLEEDDDDEDGDDLAEIDTTNIITTGRRTRGKVIDYTKTAEKLEAEGKNTVDEDEEDDGDFKEANETK